MAHGADYNHQVTADSSDIHHQVVPGYCNSEIVLVAEAVVAVVVVVVHVAVVVVVVVVVDCTFGYYRQHTDSYYHSDWPGYNSEAEVPYDWVDLVAAGAWEVVVGFAGVLNSFVGTIVAADAVVDPGEVDLLGEEALGNLG